MRHTSSLAGILQSFAGNGASLTVRQLIVLLILPRDIAKATDFSTLAREARITKSVLTGILDKFSARGYVKRKRNDDDGRLVLVSLTAKAIELLRKASL